MQTKSLFQSAAKRKTNDAQQFILKNQMPDMQVKLFLQQAIDNHYSVTVQLNPTKETERYIEMSGHLHIIGQQQQMVLQSSDGVLTFFINPQTVRYISRN